MGLQQQAGQAGDSVDTGLRHGISWLAGPDSLCPALLAQARRHGARAHAQMSRFTAGAGPRPPGLGGKWEPNLVRPRPLATEMQMLVAARQPAGTSQAWAAG